MKVLRSLESACLLSAIVTAVSSATATAANWPQWRGPQGQGISTETQLPTAWSPTSGVAWKTPIAGRGHSAPVVWGNRVFVTTAVEGDVVAWHEAPAHMDGGKPFLHPDNGSEWIIAYEPATGRELWRTAGVRSNAIHTPLVGAGLVIVTAGFPERRVIAIRPGTAGTQVGGEDGGRLGGRRLPVGTEVTPADRIAWTYEKGTAYVVSPILYKDVVYLLNDRGVITALDARTGAVIYEGGRIPKPATFMGSPWHLAITCCSRARTARRFS